MGNKSESFYLAKEILMYEVDRKNAAIRFKFETLVADDRTTPVPDFVNPPTAKKIIKIATKIQAYLDSPTEPSLLDE